MKIDTRHGCYNAVEYHGSGLPKYEFTLSLSRTQRFLLQDVSKYLCNIYVCIEYVVHPSKQFLPKSFRLSAQDANSDADVGPTTYRKSYGVDKNSKTFVLGNTKHCADL